MPATQALLAFVQTSKKPFASYFDISTNDGNHEVSPADGPPKFPVSAAKYQKLLATATGAPTIGGSSGISTIPVPATGTTSFNVTTPAVVVGFVRDSTNHDWGKMSLTPRSVSQ